MATVQNFLDAVDEIGALTEGVAKTVEGFSPAAVVPIEAGIAAGEYLIKLIGVAVRTYNAASDTPITPETIAALAADNTPLVAPTDDPPQDTPVATADVPTVE